MGGHYVIRINQVYFLNSFTNDRKWKQSQNSQNLLAKSNKIDKYDYLKNSFTRCITTYKLTET